MQGAALTRIISGGQTGVDRAALDAALEAGFQCGGWCPAGRWAEDGAIAARYPLAETESTDPAERTAANVAAADATLILTDGADDPGTQLTIAIAEKLKKPVLIVDFTAPEGQPLDTTGTAAEGAREWLSGLDVRTLNVAGPRESRAPGIYTLARGFMALLLGR
ncbi:MAG: putative molybdenum carrier protein [Rhodospirillales bacterium]|jgi:hypothetical protein|nr:putative molybdenum carrier protein [Rhodospirillales bacterium]MDP6645297.1 putative molybdenum carrier protein [Rhodospirillales bacterium]MDP6841623.1 putative molybdenum carrier protein [Rhodospirillales bacterium]|tara:strand:- start:1277 stop:1768 length:492 start_codon:yes stop_codon:yes gene_type:complete